MIKKADAIELMEKVRTLIVDKAGTRTEGRPALATMVVADSTTANDLLSLAAAVEQTASIPLPRHW